VDEEVQVVGGGGEAFARLARSNKTATHGQQKTG
jgi:hypothetical protein